MPLLRVPARTLASLTAAALLAVGLGTSAGAASADGVGPAVAPVASMTLVKDDLKKGEKFVVAYSTKNLPAGSTVVLQRTFGTSKTFKKIASLPANKAGKYSGTTPVMGKYQFRVVVNSKYGKRLTSSKVRNLRSYEWIDWARLTSDSTSTVQIGGALFRYVRSVGSGTGTVFALDRSTCRMSEIDAAKDEGDTGTVAVIQEKLDQASMTSQVGVVKTLRAKLGIDQAVRVDVTDPSDGGTTYVNGRYLCFTSDGER